MKALYKKGSIRLGLVFVLFLGGCSQVGPETKIQSPSPSGRTFLGSYQAHVTLDPPTISFEPVKPSDLNTQGLAGTDLITTAFPFRIRGSLSFDAGTATISVTMTNTSSAATLNIVDVRIRSITDLNITILGDTPAEPSVPGGIVPGGYFLLGTVNPNNGTANDTWVFQNVTGDYRFWFDVYGSSWSPTSTSGAPSGRSSYTAIWTGNEMIIWGGWTSTGYANTGGKYDPITDSWQSTSTSGAPSARYSHTAVWTESEMIVWGGWDNVTNWTNTGGRYNPSKDSWNATSTVDAPSARREHTAIWTGTEMIVWGGSQDIIPCNVTNFYTGGRYNPNSDSWTTTSNINAPSARSCHTAIWTDSQMIVWGGTGGDSGGKYNPSTDSWQTTSTTGAPSGVKYHTAVWTGTKMIVWGGRDNIDYFNSGGQYDPDTDTWNPTSTLGAPSARGIHTAVWTGTEMIIWGGDSVSVTNTGGLYNPATDSWNDTPVAGAPSARLSHTAVWTGTEMIIWGGYYGTNYLNTGGRYRP